MDEHEAYKQFQYLLDKSQRNFNRLRELPPYGKVHWEQYFHKAFHVYAKLWKFQQDHRQALTDMGLKRHDIGDIASKIGQLYYNYYLRTSETRFLHESYVFYEAIRTRHYFGQATNESSLAIKQLRYYARFIIICLLLNRREEVYQLMQEFQALISSYIKQFTPPDAQEWRIVIHEITMFMQADVAIPAPRQPGAPAPFKLNMRCSPTSPEARVAQHKTRLMEAIIVSYYHKQVKIAELPLDTYRMVQSLEWEEAAPSGGLDHTDSPGYMGQAPGLSVERRATDNPTKQLVYRPAATTLLPLLATSVEALPKDAVMLLYLGANAQRGVAQGAVQPGHPTVPHVPWMTPQGAVQGGAGGARPSSLTPQDLAISGPIAGPSGGSGSARSERRESSGGGGDEPVEVGGYLAQPALFLGSSHGQQDAADAVLLPEDLLPFTRRHLFLIVDSDTSYTFTRLQGKELGRPSMCLMSPMERPSELREASDTGNLFTMFLCAPVMAFCLLCGQPHPTPDTLHTLQSTIGSVLLQWGGLLASQLASTRSVWSIALQDTLLRRHMLRFVLCRAALALHHTHGLNMSFLPACSPALPPCMSANSEEVEAGVLKIAAVLGARHLFSSAHGGLAGMQASPAAATTLSN